jgi:hypothetical protein
MLEIPRAPPSHAVRVEPSHQTTGRWGPGAISLRTDKKSLRQLKVIRQMVPKAGTQLRIHLNKLVGRKEEVEEPCTSLELAKSRPFLATGPARCHPDHHWRARVHAARLACSTCSELKEYVAGIIIPIFGHLVGIYPSFQDFAGNNACVVDMKKGRYTNQVVIFLVGTRQRLRA